MQTAAARFTPRRSTAVFRVKKEYHCDTTRIPAMAAVHGGPGLCVLLWARRCRARPDAAAGAAGHLYPAQCRPAGQGAVCAAAGFAPARL